MASEIKVDFAKAKEEKKILTGLVVSCEQYAVSEVEVRFILKVNCHGTLVNIEQAEIPKLPVRVTPKALVGENVNFTITDINEDEVFGSMQEAREILQQPILDRLKAGEIMTGIVTYITPWGAYISIDGVLSGMMKNYDFSDDGTEIWRIHKKYSKIKVKYKKTSKNGNILFLPEKKKTGQILYDLEKIEPHQSFLGKVTDVSLALGIVRVLIDSNNLKVKCNFPDKFPDIKVGDKVVTTITKKTYDESIGRYRLYGKIASRVEHGENNFGRR